MNFASEKAKYEISLRLYSISGSQMWHHQQRQDENMTCSLQVLDERTNETYSIPIDAEYNSIDGNSVAKITFNGKPMAIYDPGFGNTVSTKSNISEVDGIKGILTYRGIPIEKLCNYSYEEVVYLLFYGKFPDTSEKACFRAKIARNSYVPNHIRAIINAFPDKAHPMTILIAALAAVSAGHPEFNPSMSSEGKGLGKDADARKEAAIRAFSVTGSICGLISRKRRGYTDIETVAIPGHLPYMGRFLALRDEKCAPPKDSVFKRLDIIATLHAEHGLNCSTATMLMVTSAGPDIFSALAAASASLYGPSHGGAAQAALEQLETLNTDVSAHKLLDDAQSGTRKVMGIGHRVYKTLDPRAARIAGIIEEMENEAGTSERTKGLLQRAKAINNKTRETEYFSSKKLFPNVDFYSGIVLDACEIPTDEFTMMFALERCPGWIANWLDVYEKDNQAEKRIWRPKSVYVGTPAKELIN